MIRSIWSASLCAALCACLTPVALAQGAAAPAASNPARKELAQKVVALQQPAVEGMARQLVEMPAAQLLQQAGAALQQRVPADKREAVGQEIQNDARRYVEEALPIVRDRAVKIAPDVLTPILESKLSEDELRQVIQVMQQMDSPAYRKYSALGPEMQRALTEKLVGETRTTIEPKVRAMQEATAKRLGIPPAAGSGAAPAARPASGAATKKQP